MEIQKQFLRKGRDYNRSGAQLRPKLIGLYELKDNLPNMLASNVVSHQDEGITTVFHFVVDGKGNVIQAVPLNEKARFMPTYYMNELVSILVVPSNVDGSLSDKQYESLVELVKYIKATCGLKDVKELNMRCFTDPDKFNEFILETENINTNVPK